MEHWPTYENLAIGVYQPPLPLRAPVLSIASPVLSIPSPSTNREFLTPQPPRKPKLTGCRHFHRIDSSLTAKASFPRKSPYPSTNSTKKKNRIELIQKPSNTCTPLHIGILQSQEYIYRQNTPTNLQQSQ